MIESARNKKPKSATINVAAEQVATVYAKAFLGAAEKSGETDEAIAELTSVADALAEFPKLEAVLGSALIDHEEKCRILDRVFGPKVSPLALDFLKVLSRHGRLDIVRSVDQQAQRLFDEMRGRVRVELQTATPLEDGLSHNIETALRGVLGGQPHVDASIEPALIGGVRAARRRYRIRRLGGPAIAPGTRADDHKERP